jgi:hypothetical protein
VESIDQMSKCGAEAEAGEEVAGGFIIECYDGAEDFEPAQRLAGRGGGRGALLDDLGLR